MGDVKKLLTSFCKKIEIKLRYFRKYLSDELLDEYFETYNYSRSSNYFSSELTISDIFHPVSISDGIRGTFFAALMFVFDSSNCSLQILEFWTSKYRDRLHWILKSERSMTWLNQIPICIYIFQDNSMFSNVYITQRLQLCFLDIVLVRFTDFFVPLPFWGYEINGTCPLYYKFLST